MEPPAVLRRPVRVVGIAGRPVGHPRQPLRPALVLGHRFRFTADGAVMRWTCERGCGAGGEKRYRRAEDAQRYAAAFDREDREDLGRRAPLVAGLPLRIWRTLRRPSRR